VQTGRIPTAAGTPTDAWYNDGMRIVLSRADLAFFDRAAETLHATIEPAGDCNGAACHAPGAPLKSTAWHLHFRLTAPDLSWSRVQYVEIEE
jgi:hypothetical protein